MKPTPTFKVRLILLVTVAGPLLTLLFIPNVPQGTRLWGESLNAGHAVLFGIIAAMVLWTGKASSRFVKMSLARQYFGVGLAIQGLGVLTEFIQPYFHRDCELGDMVRDGVGLTAFLCAMAAYNHLLDGDRIRLSSWVRTLLRSIAVICLAGAFSTAGIWGLAYFYRAQQFPVLASYHSFLGRKFLLTPHASLQSVDPPGDWTERRPQDCAELSFFPAEFPGVTVEEVSPDWRGHDSLTFDLFSTLPTTIPLAFRIDDHKHDYSFNDRFNLELKIAPGLNHIAVPLSAIERGPRRRHIDLSSIARILVFAVNPKDTFSLYLSPIELTP